MDEIRPTPQQLAWQNGELSMFFHFGMNTFTNREWGEGNEDPRLFNPTDLDTRQWVQTAKAAGFHYLILTAKHHDGFCLWPSRYTDHSVKSSLWKGGKGDVFGEFARACHGAGVKMGFYLSPWDRHEPTYGDSPAYNQHFKNQLTELLTGYGPVAEVWFDGANGEGPNGKKQEYDWLGFYDTIRKHQPEALIAISGPDIRWVGNEDGFAGETEWSVQDANPVYHARQIAAGVKEVWWPSECDVSIRPGWFWHQSEDAQVKSLPHLLDIYYRSVGHSSVLLLNVPPNNRGLLSDPDVSRLHEFRAARDRIFKADLARHQLVQASSEVPGHGASHVVDGNAHTYWSPAPGDTAPTLTVDPGAPVRFNTLLLQEHIAEGQRVAGYRAEVFTAAGWQPLHQGTTVGHTKLDRVATVTGRQVRVSILESQGPPQIQEIGLYLDPDRG